jgi:hypothetical protein
MVKKKKEVKEETTQEFPVVYDGLVKINNKKLINDFVCAKCLKTIGANQRFVLIGTYEFKEKDKENLNVGLVSEYFYHIQCWVDYFNGKVTERLINSQSQVMEMLKSNPMFNSLIKNASEMRI